MSNSTGNHPPIKNTLDVTIILPTYREASSLPLSIPRIGAVLNESGLRYEILVVDDNSPDGTADVARKLGSEYPVRVLVRTHERGLATAVMEGFRQSWAEVCVVMDADGSHPPERIPDLVKPVLAGTTPLAVGSRHISGGEIGKWPWYRQVISKTAALMTLGLTKMSDPTTGFMAVKRTALAHIKLNPVGWKIVLEVAVKLGSNPREVPIRFEDRTHGESKMSFREQWNFIRHLHRLHEYKRPRLMQYLQFCFIGLLGVFVDLMVVVALKSQLALDTRLCAIAGFSLAATHNYVLNRIWTFRQRPAPSFARSYLLFLFVCGSGLAARMAVIQAMMMAGFDNGLYYLGSNFLGIALASVLNFFGSKYLAFNTRPLSVSCPHSAAEVSPTDTP